MNDFGPKRPMSEDALCESTDTVKAKRGRPKKKPDYDREKEIEALQQKVIDLFGEPFDDRVERSEAAPSIREIAKALDTTPLTVRKMLITAGYYSTKHSREVQELYEQGCTIQEIMDQTGLKRASVHGYLPYTKGNYNLPELPLNAERRRVYRRRIAVCERLMREINSPNAEECLWDAIVAFAGYPFVTEKCIPSVQTLYDLEKALNLPECALVKRVNGQAEVDASQWSEEKEQVGRACRELEHALAANLTKSNLRKASDAISTIAKMLSGTEASSNKK